MYAIIDHLRHRRKWEGNAFSLRLELIFVKSLQCVSFLQFVAEPKLELNSSPFQS